MNYWDLIPFRKGDLWGYCDREGNVLLNPKYGILSGFKYGLAYFSLPFDSSKRVNVGVMNHKFEIVVEPMTSGIDIDIEEIIFENVLPIKYQFNFFGSIDLVKKSDKFKEDQKYRSKYRLNENQFLGFQIVKSNNYNNNPIIKLHFLNDEDGFIQPDFLPDLIDSSVARFLIYLKTQFGITSINGKSGHYLESGKLTIPYHFDKIVHSFNGVFIAFQNLKYSLITDDGDVITSNLYDELTFHNRDRVWIGKANGEFFIIEMDSNHVTKEMGYNPLPQFEIFSNKVKFTTGKGIRNDYSNSKLKYGLKIRMNYYSDQFETLFSPCFDKIEDLGYGGFAKVKLWGKFGIVDFEGVFTIPNLYDTIEYLGNRLFLVSVLSGFGTKFAIISARNKVFHEINKMTIPFIGKHEEIGFYDIVVISRAALGLVDIYFKSKYGGKFFFGSLNYLNGKEYWDGKVEYEFQSVGIEN